MSTEKPHRRLSLTQPSGAPAPEKAEPPQVAALRTEIEAVRARLGEWDDRLARIEAAVERLAAPPPPPEEPAPSSSPAGYVVAPFRVRDAAGRTVLEVDTAGGRPFLRLYDQAGAPVASLPDHPPAEATTPASQPGISGPVPPGELRVSVRNTSGVAPSCATVAAALRTPPAHGTAQVHARSVSFVAPPRSAAGGLRIFDEAGHLVFADATP